MKAIDFIELSMLTGSFQDAADWLVNQALKPGPKPTPIVVHINANNYYHLLRNPRLFARRRELQLILDGVGLKLGALLLGLGKVPALNGTDLFPMVMQRAAGLGLPVYFIGATNWAVQQAAKRAALRFRGLDITGCHSGYFDRDEEPEIVVAVRGSGARMLLIGRGFVKQEDFALRHRNDFGVSLIWTVGGLFDFISENKPRAGATMRRLHLEWLFRLGLEPRRTRHRNFVAAPWFIGHVCRRAISSRNARRQRANR